MRQTNAISADYIRTVNATYRATGVVGPMIGVSSLNAGTPKFRVTSAAADPYIYHHKWMFVADMYRGFNVDQAKRWSETWENHPIVRALAAGPDEHFRLRIGKQAYWQTRVLAPIRRSR